MAASPSNCVCNSTRMKCVTCIITQNDIDKKTDPDRKRCDYCGKWTYSSATCSQCDKPLCQECYCEYEMCLNHCADQTPDPLHTRVSIKASCSNQCNTDIMKIVWCDQCEQRICEECACVCERCDKPLCDLCYLDIQYCTYHECEVIFEDSIRLIKRTFCSICNKNRSDVNCYGCQTPLCESCGTKSRIYGRPGYLCKRCERRFIRLAESE